MEVLFLILNLCFALFVFFLTIAFITGAPFVPSTSASSSALLRLAHIKPNMKVYDLGSGDGRLLFEAARLGAVAYGIEINPLLVLYTKLRIVFSPYRSRIRVQWGNFWNANLNNADVVCIYLLPWRMEKLEKLLLTRARKGTIIVSNSFVFPHLEQTGHDELTHSYAFKT
ncbi:hypothetical protein HY947_01415 [Candidatus Gottesmanbacteria bacterium]|nr:hypothetical protein [Candidatus Gottesmanbacteria bacterium]